MKKLVTVNNNSTPVDLAILIARIAISVLMLTHGLPKAAQLFSGGPVQFPAIFGMSPALSLSLAVFAEVFCSVLLLFGFGTRLAAIPLAITMFVAIITVHAGDPISKSESALHYLLVYVVLLLAGSGKFSLDYLVQSRKAELKLAPVKIDDPTLSIYQ
jgi:putative oxidoreductase